MTAKRRKSLRISAFHAQHGRCFYCGLPMWLAAPFRARAEAWQGAPLPMHRRALGRPAGRGPRRIRERGGRACPVQPVQAQANGTSSFR